MPPDRTDPIEPVRPAESSASVDVEGSPPAGDDLPRVAIIGCGALGRELVTLTRDLPGVRVLGVDARLHMRPERIAAAVEARIDEARRRWGDDIRLFVAYADCGTGGALDAVLAREQVDRIEGAHCYEFYAGSASYEAMQDQEPGTFYLTDFLARQFDSIVWTGLGLDRHPELLPLYFANYRRLVYLAQTDDDALTTRARDAAERLGLAFERRATGLGDMAVAIRAATADPVIPSAATRRPAAHPTVPLGTGAA